jgi:hypothetical protein
MYPIVVSFRVVTCFVELEHAARVVVVIHHSSMLVIEWPIRDIDMMEQVPRVRHEDSYGHDLRLPYIPRPHSSVHHSFPDSIQCLRWN